MARQKGSANFAGTLEVLAGGPLDARSQVPTKADLTIASNFPYPYVGMQVYVLSEGKRYTLKAADVTVLANWEEEGSGSQVDTSKLYSTDDTAFTALDDADYVPVYDTSASAKKKTLWSNIKSVLKTYFDTLYQTVLTSGDGINITANEISTERMESSDIDDLDLDGAGQPSGMVIDFDGNELVIGTVIQNGVRKPLYQMSFVSSPAIVATADTFAMTNYVLSDTVCFYGGIAVNEYNVGYPIVVTKDSSTNKLQIMHFRNGTTINFINVTFQYTKTT